MKTQGVVTFSRSDSQYVDESWLKPKNNQSASPFPPPPSRYRALSGGKKADNL